MGFFRKARPRREHPWAAVAHAPDNDTSNTNNGGATPHDAAAANDDAHARKDLIDSLATTMMTSMGSLFADEASCDASHPTSSPGYVARVSHGSSNTSGSIDHELVQRVHRLERQLQERDESLAQLRGAMDAQEEAQEERIRLLQRQLELLVEAPRKLSHGHSPDEQEAPPAEVQGQGGDDGPGETAALRELLARVIAERDRLAFENQIVRTELRRHASHGREAGGIHAIIDRRIEEIESLLRSESQKSQDSAGSHLVCHDSVPDNHDIRLDTSPKGSEGDAPQTVEEQILYRLSYATARYLGSYDATCRHTTRRELPGILKQHFGEVWRMVQKQQSGEGQEGQHPKTGQGQVQGQGGDEVFISSTLAQDLVQCCAGCSTEDEVVRWCMQNVKVEIEKVQVVDSGEGNSTSKGRIKGNGKKVGSKKRYGARTNARKVSF